MPKSTSRPCTFPDCENPKVPGRGSKLCQEHRAGARQRKLDSLRNATCSMPDCTDPKITSTNPAGRLRPFRYCEKHSTEAPQRESRRVHQRKRERVYGVTHDEFLALLAAQDGVCAICGGTEESKRQRTLSVDHDHATGVVRGLLCNRCNPMLGYARDDIAVLHAAIEYLSR